MRVKAVYVILASLLIGGVAYASIRNDVERARSSPLFAASLRRSIAEMEGRIAKQPQRLCRVAFGVPRQETMEGPTCDFSLCPSGCSRTENGNWTCRLGCGGVTQSGATCGTTCSYTSCGENTCEGGGCGITSASTCAGTTCDGGGSCEEPTQSGTTCAQEPTCNYLTCLYGTTCTVPCGG
jgi:hypothetical protein